jgi:hypothetical protein
LYQKAIEKGLNITIIARKMMDEVLSTGDLESGKKTLKWMFTIEELYTDALIYLNRVVKQMLIKKERADEMDIARGDVDGVLKLLSEVPEDMFTTLTLRMQRALVSLNISYILKKV